MKVATGGLVVESSRLWFSRNVGISASARFVWPCQACLSIQVLALSSSSVSVTSSVSNEHEYEQEHKQHDAFICDRPAAMLSLRVCLPQLVCLQSYRQTYDVMIAIVTIPWLALTNIIVIYHSYAFCKAKGHTANIAILEHCNVCPPIAQYSSRQLQRR